MLFIFIIGPPAWILTIRISFLNFIAKGDSPIAYEKGESHMIEKVRLADKFAQFSDTWSPKIVGEVNDAHIKLVKLKGEFVWHHHEQEDELFLVISGHLVIRLRDRDIHLDAGEFVIIPRGVEHLPVAEEEVQVLLLEPKTTLNTGSVINERTVANPERL
jgi:mannose-6-phosphate isomerase-like protein (cupin superfamily)